MLPAPPNSTTVPAPVYPAPPKLVAGMDHGDVQQLLTVAYCSALTELTGRKVVIPASRITDVKLIGTLASAYDTMLEHDVLPHPWVAFSLERWRGIKAPGKRPDRPPMVWVYSPDRLKSQSAWYAESSHMICERRVVLTKWHRELLNKWAALEDAVVAARPTTAAEVASVFARHFPNGLFDVLVERATAETEKLQEGWHRRLRGGAWVWSLT